MPGCRLVGLLDRNRELWGKEMAGVPVLGGDELLDKLRAEGIHHAFIGVGSAGNSARRQKLYELALSHGFQVVPAIHPQAVISPSARIGAGVAIMAGAIINADAQIGDNVIINTGAIVEHDCSSATTPTSRRALCLRAASVLATARMSASAPAFDKA